jgi:hypothetical protein
MCWMLVYAVLDNFLQPTWAGTELQHDKIIIGWCDNFNQDMKYLG